MQKLFQNEGQFTTSLDHGQHAPGTNTRQDPANPAWDPGSISAGIMERHPKRDPTLDPRSQG